MMENEVDSGQRSSGVDPAELRASGLELDLARLGERRDAVARLLDCLVKRAACDTSGCWIRSLKPEARSLKPLHEAITLWLSTTASGAGKDSW